MVGLVGKKRCGKDTFFLELWNQMWFFGRVKHPLQSPERFAFADALKEELCEILGITPEYLNEHKEFFRSALQEHGSRRREENKGYWIEELVLSEKWRHSRGWKIITDVRHQNEADFIKSQDGLLIRITRPGTDSPEDRHESETELEKIQCDHVLCNDKDLAEFRFKVAWIIPVLLGVAKL